MCHCKLGKWLDNSYSPAALSWEFGGGVGMCIAFTPRIFLPIFLCHKIPWNLTFACQVQLRKDRPMMPMILNTNVRERYKPGKLRLSMLARQRSKNRNSFRGLHGHVLARSAISCAACTLPGNSPVVSSHRSKPGEWIGTTPSTRGRMWPLSAQATDWARLGIHGCD